MLARRSPLPLSLQPGGIRLPGILAVMGASHDRSLAVCCSRSQHGGGRGSGGGGKGRSPLQMARRLGVAGAAAAGRFCRMAGGRLGGEASPPRLCCLLALQKQHLWGRASFLSNGTGGHIPDRAMLIAALLCSGPIFHGQAEEQASRSMVYARGVGCPLSPWRQTLHTPIGNTSQPATTSVKSSDFIWANTDLS